MKNIFILLSVFCIASCSQSDREVNFKDLQNRGEEQAPKLFEVNKEEGFTGIVLNDKVLLTAFTIQLPIVELKEIDSSRCEYKNGQRNGNSIFYKKGAIVFIEHYENGLLSGLSTAFYSNGQKKQEIEFNNDSLVKIIGEWQENGVKNTTVETTSKQTYSYKYIAPLFVVNFLDTVFNKKSEKVYRIELFIKYNDNNFCMTVPNQELLLQGKIKMDTLQGMWTNDYSNTNVKRFKTEIPFKTSPRPSLKYIEVTFGRNLPEEIRIDPYIIVNVYNGLLEDGKGNKISDDNKIWTGD